MITEQKLRGDGVYAEISSDYTITRLARIYNLKPTTSGLNVNLPDALMVKTGGPNYYVVNVGAYSLTLKDDGGTTVATIPSADCAQVSCVDNSTSDGVWTVVVTDMTGVTPEGGGTGVVTLSAQMTIGTAFQSFLDVHGEVLLDAILNVDTAFSGNLTFATSKELTAQMAIATAFSGEFAIYPTTNIVSPSATGSGDGSLGDPWTLAEAAAAVSAGTTVYLRGGTYARSSAHTIDAANATVNNGSSGGGYITYKNYPGETPTILGTFNINGSEYLRFEGQHFHSTYAYWINTATSSGTQNHIQIANCTFSSDLGSNQYFTGLQIWSCDDLEITGCKFYPWRGGDAVRIYYSSDLLIEDCDFGQAGGNHNLIGLIDVVDGAIRNCKFRNPWARCFSLRENNTAGPLLVENCVFIDCDYDGVHQSGDPDWEDGSGEICRLASTRIIYRNNVLVNAEGGKIHKPSGDYSYYGALCLNLHDEYNEVQNCRVYHNTLWDNRPNNISCIGNPSAGTLYTTDNRFMNNVLANPEFYSIRIDDEQMDFQTWEFDTNLIYHPTNSTDIYILTDPDRVLSVANAEAYYSTVFKNSIDQAPTFVDDSLSDAVDGNPSLMAAYALEDFFDAFILDATSYGYQGAKELTKVSSSGGPTTTIPVYDAYVFWAGNTLMVGDEITIGSNNPVTVTAINSAGSIEVSSSISFTIGDDIYLTRTGTNPSIGVHSLAVTQSSEFSGTLAVDTAFSGALTYDTLTLAAAMSVGTAFSGEISTENSIAQMLHEGGDTSEYDSFVSGGGDLSVEAAAAMDGTSYGLQAVINSTDSIYGDKNFVWTTDYLRWRFYFDPNGVATTSNTSLYVCDMLTAANSLRAYVAGYVTTGGSYTIKAAVTDDAYGNQSTASYSITDAPHYIEVEIKRASSDVASDGWLKLWIDGTLKETVSSLDIYNISVPAKIRVGATRNVNAGLSGTFYLDEFIVRDSSTEIGA